MRRGVRLGSIIWSVDWSDGSVTIKFMSYRTVEVELENGVVRPAGAETLPASGHGLLMLFPVGAASPARSCTELAKWWGTRTRLSEAEAKSFADDVEGARFELGSVKSKWD